jgi:hypothetical protein
LAAIAADIGANSAVFVHLGVLFAGDCARQAALAADLDLIKEQTPVWFRLAHKNVPCCLADVGTIEISADAMRQVRHHFFCQTSVRTSRTSRCTNHTSFYTAG